MTILKWKASAVQKEQPLKTYKTTYNYIYWLSEMT